MFYFLNNQFVCLFLFNVRRFQLNGDSMTGALHTMRWANNPDTLINLTLVAQLFQWLLTRKSRGQILAGVKILTEYFCFCNGKGKMRNRFRGTTTRHTLKKKKLEWARDSQQNVVDSHDDHVDVFETITYFTVIKFSKL